MSKKTSDTFDTRGEFVLYWDIEAKEDDSYLVPRIIAQAIDSEWADRLADWCNAAARRHPTGSSAGS